MLAAFCFEFSEVDVALRIAPGDHDLHPHHLRARGIRAVGRRGDQAHIALALAAGLLPGLDHEQAGIFPLAAGVGLEADAGVARGLGEPFAELPLEHCIALALVGGGEGMDVCELRPRDRDHLARGVELHRATAERDHRAVEREIAVGERPDVAEHRRLGVVRVEHRMREEVARAPQGCGHTRRPPRLILRKFRHRAAGSAGKRFPQADDVGPRRRFIEGDANCAGAEPPQVHARSAGTGRDVVGTRLDIDGERVEGMGVAEPIADALQAVGEDRRIGRDAFRDPHEPCRAVIHRIHARDDGGEHLRGADVARSLLAADVLLAGLEREPVGRLAVGVDAHAHEPPRQRPLELVAAGEKRRMGAAAAHRHPEALRRAHDDVGPPLARRREQHERKEIRGHAQGRLLRVHAVGTAAVIHDLAVGGRVLHERAEAVVRVEQRRHVAHDDVDPEWLGPRAKHFERLRMHPGVGQERVARALGGAFGERHRLGGGSGLVEERRIRDRHRREVADHRLKVDDRLHPPLGDLGLVGRVGRVPRGIFQDVAQDHGRRVRAVVALADEARAHLVAGGDRAQLRERRRLGDGGRQPHRRRLRDARRDDFGDQGLA